MDFATLPPEVNSGLMYAGPGSGPMIAAAASWDNLATELFSAAGDYGSVISGLTSGPWRGPASASMVAAAAPYVSWMSATAAQAEQAAGQAKAAAGAYETAFGLTVPPSVIAANRTLLASLISTNILGQNTPAIATTETHYAEMWAQDAAAMYGYAGSSAAASTLTPFVEPPVTTTATGAAAQAGAVAQATGTGTQTTVSQLVTAVPAALQALAAPATSSGLGSGLMNVLNFLTGNGSGTGLSAIFNELFSSSGLGLNNNLWNTIFSSGFYMPGNWLGTMTDLVGLEALAGADQAAAAADNAAAAAEGVAGEGLGGALAGPAAGVGELGGLGGAVSAALGRGTALGALAVPPSWNAVAPVTSPIAPMLGGAPLSAPPAVAAGMPGMPFANPAGNHLNGTTPRYGFRPTVVAHPPAAG
ncbi:PPE family protein [Mycobacterium sp.]|uniref:PPE family protein n=1 Tax=Mycobacterium sp. TaxID=1785 RepID=UPI003F9AC7AC